MVERETEVIVVGTGAGGATIARELSRKGKRVLMLERGARHRRLFGTHLGVVRMLDKFGFIQLESLQNMFLLDSNMPQQKNLSAKGCGSTFCLRYDNRHKRLNPDLYHLVIIGLERNILEVLPRVTVGPGLYGIGRRN